VAIIIGDIHGDLAVARVFLAYRPKAAHIALGDVVDSRKNISYEDELACLEFLLSSDAMLLWGNHDLAYLPERPWRPYGKYGEQAFRQQFQQHRHRFQAALAVDGWLLTHAGVAPQIAKMMPAEVIAGGVEEVAAWLNQEFERQLKIANPEVIREPRHGYGPLFQIPYCRGGHDYFGGIFWFDPEGEQSQPAPLFPQIFGHTPVSRLQGKGWIISHGRVVDGARWVNLNAERGIWIFDTETDDVEQVG